jgi:hypothetical protein|tara:strand:- start:40 stop:306 length:267 start_codon:yes stop_codon:yes gene_type:complete
MWSGEDVIAELQDNLEDFIVIINPIVAIPTNGGQIGFAPWSPLLKSRGVELKITQKYIVYISDPQEEIIEQYKQMYSTIQTPSKKLVL